MNDTVSFVVVGHLPPPVTGENLCRAQLVKSLKVLGCRIMDLPRGRRAFYQKGGLIVLNGESICGTCFDFFLTLYALLRGNQVYWYFHNASWRRFAHLPAWFFWRGAERIHVVVLRPLIADEFRRAGYKSIVLNNRIESAFEEQKVPLPEIPPKRLIWMGRPDIPKGFPLALEVFGMLSNQDASWRFDVYGADNTYAKINDYLLHNVQYHGFINGEAKVAAFCQGGIFILPSQYRNETQPLSIIEALSCGIPVVASNVGGIPEMLDGSDGPAGISLESRKAEDYVNTINEILVNYNYFSENARKIYREKFCIDRFSKNVARIFRFPSKD